MKRISIIVVTALLVLSNFVGVSNTPVSNADLKDAFVDEFLIQGETHHKFSKNYTLNLRVTGVTTELRKSIDYVEYKKDDVWERVPYYNVSYDKHIYYVIVDEEKYYFSFGTSKHDFK